MSSAVDYSWCGMADTKNMDEMKQSRTEQNKQNRRERKRTGENRREQKRTEEKRREQKRTERREENRTERSLHVSFFDHPIVALGLV